MLHILRSSPLRFLWTVVGLLGLQFGDVAEAVPMCYASVVDQDPSCDSPNLCLPVPGIRSPTQCGKLEDQYPNADVFHPIFAPDEFACRYHVQRLRKCASDILRKNTIGGDIFLSKSQAMNLDGFGSKVLPWPAVRGDRYAVPFVLESYETWSPLLKNNWDWSLRWIEVNTRIRFVTRSNQTSYLVVVGDAKSCGSYLGQAGGAQPLLLGPECQSRHDVGHLLMHALGMGHVHQRADRDDMIRLHSENIRNGQQEVFLRDTRLVEVRSEFDFASILLVSPFDIRYSKDGHPTYNIRPHVPNCSVSDCAALAAAHPISPSSCDFETLNRWIYPSKTDDIKTKEVPANTTKEGIPCIPNTLFPMCVPTLHCPVENCDELCRYECEDQLEKLWCELKHTTQELLEIVATRDAGLRLAPT